MTGRRETLSRLPARHEAPGFPLPLKPAAGRRCAAADPTGTVHRKHLAMKFAICSHIRMERIEREQLSAILLSAPGWARVGLTMPDAQMRERAADTLAATIIDKLFGEPPVDRNQLRLPL